MRRSILLIACVVALALVATPASADIVFEDRGLANGGDTVFAGHPASFTGVCPYGNLGPGLPEGGCIAKYSFHIPDHHDGDNSVESTVDYETEVVSLNPCVKSADLDLFFYDEDGNLLKQDTGCDSGFLSMDATDLPSGNYVVEVRGNWGAVVDYHAKGVLSY